MHNYTECLTLTSILETRKKKCRLGVYLHCILQTGLILISNFSFSWILYGIKIKYGMF